MAEVSADKILPLLSLAVGKSNGPFDNPLPPFVLLFLISLYPLSYSFVLSFVRNCLQIKRRPCYLWLARCSRPVPQVSWYSPLALLPPLL